MRKTGKADTKRRRRIISRKGSYQGGFLFLFVVSVSFLVLLFGRVELAVVSISTFERVKEEKKREE